MQRHSFGVTSHGDMDAFLRRLIIFMCIFQLNVVIEGIDDYVMSTPNNPIYVDVKEVLWNVINSDRFDVEKNVILTIRNIDEIASLNIIMGNPIMGYTYINTIFAMLLNYGQARN